MPTCQIRSSFFAMSSDESNVIASEQPDVDTPVNPPRVSAVTNSATNANNRGSTSLSSDDGGRRRLEDELNASETQPSLEEGSVASAERDDHDALLSSSSSSSDDSTIDIGDEDDADEEDEEDEVEDEVEDEDEVEAEDEDVEEGSDEAVKERKKKQIEKYEESGAATITGTDEIFHDVDDFDLADENPKINITLDRSKLKEIDDDEESNVNAWHFSYDEQTNQVVVPVSFADYNYFGNSLQNDPLSETFKGRHVVHTKAIARVLGQTPKEHLFDPISEADLSAFNIIDKKLNPNDLLSEVPLILKPLRDQFALVSKVYQRIKDKDKERQSKATGGEKTRGSIKSWDVQRRKWKLVLEVYNFYRFLYPNFTWEQLDSLVDRRFGNATCEKRLKDKMLSDAHVVRAQLMQRQKVENATKANTDELKSAKAQLATTTDELQELEEEFEALKKQKNVPRSAEAKKVYRAKFQETKEALRALRKRKLGASKNIVNATKKQRTVDTLNKPDDTVNHAARNQAFRADEYPTPREIVALPDRGESWRPPTAERATDGRLTTNYAPPGHDFKTFARAEANKLLELARVLVKTGQMKPIEDLHTFLFEINALCGQNQDNPVKPFEFTMKQKQVLYYCYLVSREEGVCKRDTNLLCCGVASEGFANWNDVRNMNSQTMVTNLKDMCESGQSKEKVEAVWTKIHDFAQKIQASCGGEVPFDLGHDKDKRITDWKLNRLTVKRFQICAMFRGGFLVDLHTKKILMALDLHDWEERPALPEQIQNGRRMRTGIVINDYTDKSIQSSLLTWVDPKTQFELQDAIIGVGKWIERKKKGYWGEFTQTLPENEKTRLANDKVEESCNRIFQYYRAMKGGGLKKKRNRENKANMVLTADMNASD